MDSILFLANRLGYSGNYLQGYGTGIRKQVNIVQAIFANRSVKGIEGRMSLNIVHLVGRAGSDPQVRYFDSGSVLCEFNIAVNRRSRDEQPDWFSLKIWGKTAEVAANYVRKGGLVGIEGTLVIDTWQDRATGVNRSKPVINVERLDLLGSKRDNEGGGYQGGSQSYSSSGEF